MKTYRLMALTALVALTYSNSDADLRSRLRDSANRARNDVSRRVEEQRGRAESFRDETRSKLKDSADRTRNSLNDAGERTQNYYHERLEGKVEEERRRFEENPEGYSADLGRRINKGVIQFEDIASDGIAQGFVDIECGDGVRLGNVIETRFGIKEEHTQKGVKLGVLYLMGYNPLYFVDELPIVENGQGRMVTISEIKDSSEFSSTGQNLERYIMETSENYRKGDFRAAERSLAAFKKELDDLAEIYSANKEREERNRETDAEKTRITKEERTRYRQVGFQTYVEGIGRRLKSREIDSLPLWAINISPVLFRLITESNPHITSLLEKQFSTDFESMTVNALGYLMAYNPQVLSQLELITNIFGETISVQEAGYIPGLKRTADEVDRFLSNPYTYAVMRFDCEEEIEMFGENLRDLRAGYSALSYRSKGGDMDFASWVPQVVVDNIMLEEIKLRNTRSDFSGLDYLDAIGFGVSDALDQVLGN